VTNVLRMSATANSRLAARPPFIVARFVSRHADEPDPNMRYPPTGTIPG